MEMERLQVEDNATPDKNHREARWSLYKFRKVFGRKSLRNTTRFAPVDPRRITLDSVIHSTNIPKCHSPVFSSSSESNSTLLPSHASICKEKRSLSLVPMWALASRHQSILPPWILESWFLRAGAKRRERLPWRVSPLCPARGWTFFTAPSLPTNYL